MARQAVIVGNTASYSHGQKIATPAVMKRTLNLIATTLANFPGDYAFNVTQLLDQTPDEVQDAFRVSAQKAANTNSLILFYYFGHGLLSPDLNLMFLHSTGTPEHPATLALQSLEYTIQVVQGRRSLFILDCCYSGARTYIFPFTLNGQQHCRLASTTPASLAHLIADDLSDPIGVFTRTIIDGLSSSVACVSPADNSITAQTLFNYAYIETDRMTNSIQQPTISGNLSEALTVYRRIPVIEMGVTDFADEKTGYKKIRAIVQTISRMRPRDITSLYNSIIRRHPEAFKTLHKVGDDDYKNYPVQESVIYRYVLFLRRLGFIDREHLSLTRRGAGLLAYSETHYNERLLDAIVVYLRRFQLDIETLDQIMSQILASRKVPSREEILYYLTLAGYRFHKQDLSMILDILGYIGVIRMSAKRAFFPWQ